MSVSAADILASFPTLLRHHSGSMDVQVHGPCAQTAPGQGLVAFVSDEKHLLPLLKADLALIVAPAKLASKAIDAKATVFLSNNTYLAMALTNQKFFPVVHRKKRHSDQRIHPSAQIHPTAQIDTSVAIGPNTVIYDNVTIGAGTFIGANCVIESNVQIGKDCYIHHMVYIGHTTNIGSAVEIKPNSTISSDGFGFAHDEKGNHYKIPHYGPLIIEDDVHIGANVNIDRGTYDLAKIGRGTKIDNHVHIGHNNILGENCLLTAAFVSAGSVKIGSNCVFGGRSSINGHIEICDGVTLGGATVAVGDITKPGAYVGFPPLPFKEGLKVQASIASLPRIRKNLSQVMKQLGLTEES